MAAKCADAAPTVDALPTAYPALAETERIFVTKPAPAAIGAVLETAIAAMQAAGWLIDV